MSRLATVLVVALALASAASAQRGVKAWIGGTWRQVPLQMNCSITTANPPQRTVNCKVTNLLQVPLCANLLCTPRPAGNCGGQTDYGLWWLTGQVPANPSTTDCSWNVKRNIPGRCSSPQAIQPGNDWSFGYMTSYKGPINVKLPAWPIAAIQSVDGNRCS